MKCNACGEPILSSWKYCASCSAEIATVDAAKDTIQKHDPEAEAPREAHVKQGGGLGRWVLPGVGAVLLIGYIASVQPNGPLSSQNSEGVQTASTKSVEAELTALREMLAADNITEMQTFIASMKQIENAEQQRQFEDIRVEAFNKKAEQLVAAIDSSELETEQKFELLQTEVQAARRAFIETEQGIASLEQKALELVRPIPASDAVTNAAGYGVLAVLRPQNAEYTEKLSAYEVTATQQRQARREAERTERESQRAADLAARKKPFEDRRREILSKYRSEADKFSETTFYTHRNSPRYLNSRSTVYLYMGIRNDRPYLRLKIIYTAESWLFFRRVQVFGDGDVRTLFTGNSFDVDRDNGSGKVWEWVDVAPTTSQVSALRLMATASEATIRFSGSEYRKDINLGRGDKAALGDVLADFDELEEVLSELRSMR